MKPVIIGKTFVMEYKYKKLEVLKMEYQTTIDSIHNHASRSRSRTTRPFNTDPKS
jgi:hypothetical protein